MSKQCYVLRSFLEKSIPEIDTLDTGKHRQRNGRRFKVFYLELCFIAKEKKRN